MASNSKKSRAGDNVQKCSVPSHKSVNCQCTEVQILSTVNLPSTSRAAAVDRAINSQMISLSTMESQAEKEKKWTLCESSGLQCICLSLYLSQ